LPLTKEQHLDPNAGPKRILALDGGGIRGILTLQFLQVIESRIKERFGDNTLLCDYFDLIGGTSTGSIIAAGLACGMTVDDLQKLYLKIGASVFKPAGLGKLIPGSFKGRGRPSSRPARFRRNSTNNFAPTRRSMAPRSAPAS